MRVVLAALLLTGCQQYTASSESHTSFAFASQTLVLPEETSKLPDTPAGELVTIHCTACHSADQIQHQPKLKPEQWAATLKKMRETYHAPTPPEDDAKLIAALVELQEAK